MWFKNLIIFELVEPIDRVSLNEKLEDLAFTPCKDMDIKKSGFFPPLGKSSDALFVHIVGNFTMICVKRQEKIIPSAAVNEKLADKVAEIEKQESRGVGSKERRQIKDEIIFSMLPKAPTKSDLDYGYIDHDLGLIIVNTSSASIAEKFCSKLREALGSLRCVPVVTKHNPSHVVTHALKTGEIASDFKLGNEVELKGSIDNRVAKFKKTDLTCAQVESCLNSQMYALSVELEYKDSIFFTIDADITIKKLVFSDVITEKSNERNPETRAEQFDSDFAVMTLSLQDFIKNLFAMFGNIQKHEA